MTPSALILALAGLFVQEGAWTQRAHARNAAGDECHPSDPQAVSWDIVGGLMILAPDEDQASAAHAWLCKSIDVLDLTEWNDDIERNQEEVIDALRATAALVRIAEEATRPDRACRVCGCTETTACEDLDGPCSWIEDDLCSACDGKSEASAEDLEEAAERVYQQGLNFTQLGALYIERAADLFAKAKEIAKRGGASVRRLLAALFPRWGGA